MRTKSDEYFRKFHTPGMPNHYPRKKNAIFISSGNTVCHELAKCLGAIMLHKHGDLKFNDKIILLLREIDTAVKDLDLAKQRTDFITEAVPNSQKDRRVDLVSLSDGTRYEFESVHTICKKDPGELVITILI